MEKNERPTSTGPGPEPSLRDVIKAIDGLALRMDVIISYLDKRDTLPRPRGNGATPPGSSRNRPHRRHRNRATAPPQPARPRCRYRSPP